MTRLKVLALQRESHVAPGVPSLSVAARVTEVLDYLQSIQQLEYTSIPENNPAASNGVRWADVVIFSKHSSTRALELALQARALGKHLIYDIDDWIFSFPEYSGGKQKTAKKNCMQEILSCTDVVTVANTRLQSKIEQFIPNSHFIPNGIWVEKYTDDTLAPRKNEGVNKIVFTNADFLKLENSKEVILTALQVFFIKHPTFVIDFFGDPFPEIISLPFLHFTNRMPYEEYMQALVSGNYLFSITPLGAQEDPKAAEFNACKNPFKYLNYGAAGVPGIYSSSPIYTDCIQHGLSGWLIENTLQDWLHALELMAFDCELRERIRSNAFEDIARHHHIRYSGNALLHALRETR